MRCRRLPAGIRHRLCLREGAQTYPQGLKNGYVNGYAQGLKSGAVNGLKEGLKNGAKQGLKNGSLRGTQK